ncbi:MAG: PEP-CTERM sorting domain-containing protein [Lentisphaerota bacterium]
MRKIGLMIAVLALMGAVQMSFGAADNLNWYNGTNASGFGAERPNQPGVYLPTDASSAVGAMYQIIKTSVAAGGTPNAPSASFGSGTGLTGGDAIVTWGWCGENFEGDGVYSGAALWSSLGVIATDHIFIRVWDKPTSGSGNMPTAFDYGSGNIGGYYFNNPVIVLNQINIGPNQYYAPGNDIAATSWTFLASTVPEPGTIILGLLGLGAFGPRRYIKNSVRITSD